MEGWKSGRVEEREGGGGGVESHPTFQSSTFQSRRFASHETDGWQPDAVTGDFWGFEENRLRGRSCDGALSDSGRKSRPRHFGISRSARKRGPRPLFHLLVSLFLANPTINVSMLPE